MTDAVCSSLDDLQRRCCHWTQIVLSALAVCSIVTSGFFPPKASGLLRHERHHELAKDHVPQQSLVASSLKMRESDLALGQPEDMLHAPAGERDAQEFLEDGFGRGVGDEVFDLSGLDVPGDDQPVGPVGRASVALEMNLRRLDLPGLRRQGLPGESDPLPLLGSERLAPGDGVVNAFGGEGGLKRVVFGKRGPAHEVGRDLANIVQAEPVEGQEKAGLAAVPLVEGEPVKPHAVGQGAFDLLQGDLPLGAVNHFVGDMPSR